MKILKTWLPVIFWCLVIFYFSNIPSLHLNIKWQFIIRKTAHIIEFGILSFLLYRSLKKSTNLSIITIILISFGLTVLFSISDEFHQTFILGRVGTIRDVFIDMIGVAIFILIILFKERKNLDDPPEDNDPEPPVKNKARKNN
jgi:VanZ family protein